MRYVAEPSSNEIFFNMKMSRSTVYKYHHSTSYTEKCHEFGAGIAWYYGDDVKSGY